MVRLFLLLALLCLLLAACNFPAPTLDGEARIATAVYAGLTEAAAAASQDTPTPETPGGQSISTIQPAPTIVGETPSPSSPVGQQNTATPLPASPTLPAVSTAVPASATPTSAPLTPEQVVAAYLEAYPDGEADMLAALTPARRTNLPPGGPGALLLVQGDLEGYSILSGSEIPNPPQAVVKVALQAGGQDAVRNFSLLRQDNHWLIDSIYK